MQFIEMTRSILERRIKDNIDLMQSDMPLDTCYEYRAKAMEDLRIMLETGLISARTWNKRIDELFKLEVKGRI